MSPCTEASSRLQNALPQLLIDAESFKSFVLQGRFVLYILYTNLKWEENDKTNSNMICLIAD